MAKRTKQQNAEIIDNAITDKGNVTISMKSTKWIISFLVGLTLLILGVAWGFKANLESKMETNKTEILGKVEELDKKIDEIDENVKDLEKEEVKPNTKTNWEQDADIKILYDRTNSRASTLNGNSNRPNNLNNQPPGFMVSNDGN